MFGFDYLITDINEYIKNKLGASARGMIILDEKDIYDQEIRDLTAYRRFQVARTNRLKWLVEFSYPIDSKRHPFVQLSDLVVFCTRKFFEIECGYKKAWPDEAKKFYARCFQIIYDKKISKKVTIQTGRHAKSVNSLAEECMLKPSKNWRKKYL